MISFTRSSDWHNLSRAKSQLQFSTHLRRQHAPHTPQPRPHLSLSLSLCFLLLLLFLSNLVTSSRPRVQPIAAADGYDFDERCRYRRGGLAWQVSRMSRLGSLVPVWNPRHDTRLRFSFAVRRYLFSVCQQCDYRSWCHVTGWLTATLLFWSLTSRAI